MLDDAQAVALYKELGTLRRVADRLGSNHHSVARALLRAGVTITRRPKPAARVKIVVDCAVCGSPFRRRRETQRFCSYACTGRARAANMCAPQYPERVVLTCPTCGGTFAKPPRSKNKFCSRTCFERAHSIRMSGVSNPAWVNGSSYNKRCFRGSNWARVRKTAYSRDGYTCQRCGVKCIGRRDLRPDNGHLLIQCHHIRHYSDERDNALDNLVTLCVSCHASTHAATGSAIE